MHTDRRPIDSCVLLAGQCCGEDDFYGDEVGVRWASAVHRAIAKLRYPAAKLEVLARLGWEASVQIDCALARLRPRDSKVRGTPSEVRSSAVASRDLGRLNVMWAVMNAKV